MPKESKQDDLKGIITSIAIIGVFLFGIITFQAIVMWSAMNH